jgi:hypothetical protein
MKWRINLTSIEASIKPYYSPRNLYERLFLFYHLLEKIYFPFYGIEKGLGIQLTVASPSL